MDYHADRFVDHSLMIYDDAKLIAVFPANETETTIYSHQGLTYGSLIMNPKIKTVEVLAIFEEMKTYYREKGFQKIIYKTIPYIFHKYPAQEDLYALFRSNAQLIRRDISAVSLLQEKFSFSNSPSRHYKKCEKLGVEIQQNHSFRDYWDLLSGVLQNHYGVKPVHTLEEITKLAHVLPENIKLFEARKEGELLAGTVIFDFDFTVHTQYLANSDEGRKVGALDYLLIKLMDEEFSNRDYFSFGISTEEQGRVLNDGLINQKEMYTGRGICLDFYEIIL